MWNISQAFRSELRKPNHTPVAKCVLLDTNLNPVQGGTLFSTNKTNELTNYIADGSVDIDTSRGTRRTAEMTLLNPSAEFTPATEDFKPEGPWVGMIYLNRLVRLYRGVEVADGNDEFVPIGTFMIDTADVIVERNMSLVVLTMSDFWKRLAKTSRKSTKEWKKGTYINTVLNDLITSVGTGPLKPSIDSLTGRTDASKRLTTAFSVEEGESRGEKIKELGDNYDVDIYFDAMGRFTTQDRKRPSDKAVVWHFYSSEKSDGMLVSVKRSFNDDNLYNHVIVIGTGNPKSTIRVEKADDNPASKTNRALIGDRTYVHRSDKIKTTTQANKALNKLWQLRFHITETIECETICNPALEGDDVVQITEKNFAKVDAPYRLNRFTIPLTTARQQIGGDNIIRKEDL
jgi:hypothetical protein